MIKVILFDCDGPIIKRDKYFSERIEESGITIDREKQKAFFTTDFIQCEIGKADLKEVLPKWLLTWKWEKSVDDLLDYWFEGEAEVDLQMKEYIINLRAKGIKCFLCTNNEKYRVDYLWDVVGLNKILDNKLPSSELGFLKPDVNFWKEAYERMPKVEKNEVLVLDDEQSAIISAIEFGFNAEFYTSFENFKKVMEEKYQLK